MKFAKGLVMTYLLTIVFFAIGWLGSTADFEYSKMVVPLGVALVVWGFLYVFYKPIWSLLLVIGGCTFYIGTLLGLMILGDVLIYLAVYILPKGYLTVGPASSTLIVGLVYAIVPLIVMKEDEPPDTKPKPPENDDNDMTPAIT